jgi:hypothetical protein
MIRSKITSKTFQHTFSNKTQIYRR